MSELFSQKLAPDIYGATLVKSSQWFLAFLPVHTVAFWICLAKTPATARLGVGLFLQKARQRQLIDWLPWRRHVVYGRVQSNVLRLEHRGASQRRVEIVRTQIGGMQAATRLNAIPGRQLLWSYRFSGKTAKLVCLIKQKFIQLPLQQETGA